MIQTKDEIYNKGILDLQLDPAKIELFDFIKSKNVPMAIASNSRKENINKVLSVLKITHYFDAIVSGQDDVINPKPHPDIIYNVLTTMHGANNPKAYMKTILIEDSDDGMQAGRSAGVSCIKVNDSSEVTINLIKEWIL